MKEKENDDSLGDINKEKSEILKNQKSLIINNYPQLTKIKENERSLIFIDENERLNLERKLEKKINEKKKKELLQKMTEYELRKEKYKDKFEENQFSIANSLISYQNWINIRLKSIESEGNHNIDFDDDDIVIKLSDERIEKILNNECSLCFFFIIIGFLFIIIHFMGIQEIIIILNSTLDEITEELKIILNSNQKRKNNFYQIFKINNLRKFPQIDVALVFSFLGNCIFNCAGYFLTSFIFQIISVFILYIYFFFFKFHITQEELSNHYFYSEFFLLIGIYFSLLISVGAVTSISYDIFYRYLRIAYPKTNVIKFGERIIYSIFSVLSFTIVFFINKSFLQKYNEDKYKKLLKNIFFFYTITFVLSLIFYFIYQIPIKNIKIKTNKKIDLNIKKEENKEEEKEEENENDNLIISTCTCLGYLYYSESITQNEETKKISLLYKFQGICQWFIEILKKIEFHFIVLIFSVCRLQCIGNKLFIEYQYEKKYSDLYCLKGIGGYLLFSTILYILVLYFLIIVYFHNLYKNSPKSTQYFLIIIYISLLQSIFSLINSILKIIKIEIIDLMILSLIFFKLVDFMILGFFGKLHNDDLIKSSNGVTLVRLIWNIIDSILKSFNVQNKQILFIIQLIASIFGISYFIWRKIKAKYSNTPDFQVFINLDEEKKEEI